MLEGKMIMEEWRFWREDQNSHIKQLNSFKEG